MPSQHKLQEVTTVEKTTQKSENLPNTILATSNIQPSTFGSVSRTLEPASPDSAAVPASTSSVISIKSKKRKKQPTTTRKGKGKGKKRKDISDEEDKCQVCDEVEKRERIGYVVIFVCHSITANLTDD